MAYEDFTTYTEFDEGSAVTIDSATKVSWTNLYTRRHTAYLYKDKGVDYFSGDFHHKFELQFDTLNTKQWPTVWMLSNMVGDLDDVVSANADALVLYEYDDDPSYLYFRTCENGVWVGDSWRDVLAATLYFIEIVRDDSGGANNTGLLTAYIRTGSHTGTLKDTLTFSCSAGEQNDFRYLYALATYNDFGWNEAVDGFVQNLSIDLKLTASSGSYLITGQDTIHDKTISAEGIEILIVGSDTGLIYVPNTLDSGIFNINGQIANLIYESSMPIIEKGWETDKDLGPWAFTEQKDKWGYLNNLRWSSKQDAKDFCKIIGLTLDLEHHHKPCGHWHKDQPISETVPVDTGEWVAAQQQPETPYIYLYDIEYKAAIKIETSIPPIIADVLPLESLYSLDHSQGYGDPGAQRGGYCMGKVGDRLWYLVRDDATGSCELIEIDITQDIMSIVKKTTYSNLMPSETIQDGCTDGTYTYWCTNKTRGRIIKIRNSDHVIVDDHDMNIDLHGCASYREGYGSIDYNPSTGYLYSMYVIQETSCSPAYNACVYYRVLDTDFGYVSGRRFCGSGLSTPWSQNMVRIVGNYIMHHRSYWNSGWFARRSLDTFTALAYVRQQYLQNIFNLNSSNQIFTLMHTNAIYAQARIYCLNFSSMAVVNTHTVTAYCGWSGAGDWGKTAVSAMNVQNEVVVLFRYNTTEKRNYAVCFKADSSLNLLCDTPLDNMISSSTGDYLKSIEPQIWTMPN